MMLRDSIILVTMSTQRPDIFEAAKLMETAAIIAAAPEQERIAQRESVVNGKNNANGYC